MKHVEEHISERVKLHAGYQAQNDIADNFISQMDESLIGVLPAPEKIHFDQIDEMELTIKEIKEICIKWNLRFGELKHIKVAVPKRNQVEIADFIKNNKDEYRFFVIAPAKLFGKRAFEIRPKNVDPVVVALKARKISDNWRGLSFGDNTIGRIVTEWGNDFGFWQRIQGRLLQWIHEPRTFFSTIIIAFFLPILIGYAMDLKSHIIALTSLISFFIVFVTNMVLDTKVKPVEEVWKIE